MSEIYRIYKTAENDRTINDSLTQKAFSMALNSAVSTQIMEFAGSSKQQQKTIKYI